MKRSLTAEDVIREIEFELAQGAISRDDLGQSIQAVRKYQNQMRAALFEGKGKVAERETLANLLKLNDMLVTLLQEMAATVEGLRLDMARTQGLPERPAPPPDLAASVPAADPRLAPPTRRAAPLVHPEEALSWPPATELADAMREETLHVGMDVRAGGPPLVGGLLTRARVALHDLALFYVNRLGRTQAGVNRRYGEWLLHLYHQNQQQQAQIEALAARLGALDAPLAGGEGDDA